MNIKSIFGKISFEEMEALKALRPFDDGIIRMLNGLSKELLADKNNRAYPDIVTFAFFIRAAHLQEIKKKYDVEVNKNRIGRGLTFHIAPSNVPINFAYSMIAGLLSGNACVVRVSSKDFKQTHIIAEALERIYREHEEAMKYIALVSYEHDKEITDYLSSLSNVRIIWGGDNTIAEVRRSSLRPRAKEICFADRYSIAIISAKAVLDNDMKSLPRDFYNDTYLYDQNACTSPRLIYWINDAENELVDKAKEKFWQAIEEYLSNAIKYKVEPVVAVDKLTADYRAAILMKDVKLENQGDNLIHRISVSELNERVFELTCPGGSFIEYSSGDFFDISSIACEKLQTISCLGIDVDSLRQFILENGLRGVDRITEIGHTSDFSFVWDGYDLIYEMTRVIG